MNFFGKDRCLYLECIASGVCEAQKEVVIAKPFRFKIKQSKRLKQTSIL